MTVSKMAQAQPLRLKVLAGEGSDKNVEKIAKRMAVAALTFSRFRVASTGRRNKMRADGDVVKVWWSKKRKIELVARQPRGNFKSSS